MPETSMVLPHELFSALYHHYKEAFFTMILPSYDVLQSFWEQVAGSYVEVSKSIGIVLEKLCNNKIL